MNKSFVLIVLLLLISFTLNLKIKNNPLNHERDSYSASTNYHQKKIISHLRKQKNNIMGPLHYHNQKNAISHKDQMINNQQKQECSSTTDCSLQQNNQIYDKNIQNEETNRINSINQNNPNYPQNTQTGQTGYTAHLIQHTQQSNDYLQNIEDDENDENDSNQFNDLNTDRNNQAYISQNKKSEMETSKKIYNNFPQQQQKTTYSHQIQQKHFKKSSHL